jgi:hypothetical protein
MHYYCFTQNQYLQHGYSKIKKSYKSKINHVIIHDLDSASALSYILQYLNYATNLLFLQ